MKSALPDDEFAAARKTVDAESLHKALAEVVNAHPGLDGTLTIAIVDGPIHVGRPAGAKDRAPRKRRANDAVEPANAAPLTLAAD